MNNIIKEKKGFTLVELLAVIVILALLIVITANTVLPMMSKTKKNAMVVYASKVLDKASAAYMVDSMSNGGALKKYSIEALMGQDDYYGVVGVEMKNGKYEYSIAMFDAKEKLGLKSKYLTSTSIEKDIDTIVSPDNYNASTDTADAYRTHALVAGYNFSISEKEKTSNLVDLSKTDTSNSASCTFIYDNSTGTLTLTSDPKMYDYTLIMADELGLETGKTYYYGATAVVSGLESGKKARIAFGLNTTADNSDVYKIIDANGEVPISGSFEYTGASNTRLFMHFNYGYSGFVPVQVTFKNIFVSETSNSWEPFVG